jgi:hypothetical protein
VRRHRPVGALVEYEVEAGLPEPLRVATLRQEHARPVGEGAEVALSLRDPSLCAVYPPSAPE